LTLSAVVSMAVSPTRQSTSCSPDERSDIRGGISLLEHPHVASLMRATSVHHLSASAG
jgi:hypothetical protein